MNWIQFSLYLSAFYLAYYGLNLIYDLFYLKDPNNKLRISNNGEITFPESYSTAKVELQDEEVQQGTTENDSVLSSGPIESSGGVSIKELFSLAQNDLIEYTKAIAY